MKYLVLLFLIFFTCEMRAQQSVSDTLSINDNPEAWLPSVSLLIDSALNKSPQVLIAQKNKEELQVSLGQTKRDWMQYLSVNTQYQYRKGGTLGIVQDATGLSTAIYSDQSISNYGGGVSMGFSLSSIYERKSRIKQAKIKVETSEATIQQLKDELAQTIFEKYTDLVNGLVLLKSSADASVSFHSLSVIAEKDFVNNRIPFSEYSAAMETYKKSLSDLEKIKSDCKKLVFYLERISGVHFMENLKGKL